MKHARPDYDAIQDPRGLIPDDEPVMLIRGQDVAALPAAMAWMKAAHHAGASPEILALVGEHIGRIARWQADHKVKTPDLPGEGCNCDAAPESESWDHHQTCPRYDTPF